MPNFRFLNWILVDLNKTLPWQKISLIFLLKTPFQNWGPDPKVCGERPWLPIYKMVWHFTISSAVWVLELSEVAGKKFYGVVVVVVGVVVGKWFLIVLIREGSFKKKTYLAFNRFIFCPYRWVLMFHFGTEQLMWPVLIGLDQPRRLLSKQ